MFRAKTIGLIRLREQHQESQQREHDEDRGFEEIRGILTELFEEGSALGLTAAELFLQLHDRASEGIGSRELRKGLASLSVHLTETEVETVMAGAGCTGGSAGSDSRLALESFLAIVQDPRGQRGRVLPVETDASLPPSAAPANSSTPAANMLQPPPGVHLAHDILHEDSVNGAAESDHECVTPDSLALRMSVSELLVDVQHGGGSGGAPATAPTSTAVAHLEAFGRNVQSVLATAVSGGGTGRASDLDEYASANSANLHGRSSPTRKSSWTTPRAPLTSDLSGSATAARTGAGRSTVGEHGSTVAKKEEDKEGEEEDENGREEERGTIARTPASSRASAAALSRGGPVPRTVAITPPFGPARSPSEALHPTRASRERLEAALEGLDLKERLRPTANLRGGVDNNGGSHAASCPGARRRTSDGIVEAPVVPPESAREDAGSSRRRARSLGVQRSRPAKIGVARATADPTDPLFQRLRVVGPGGRGRAGPNESGRVAGVDERGARVRHVRSRRSGGTEPGQRKQRLGEVVDLGVETRRRTAATCDGGPEEAPELIGRLRARVAELELTEQVMVAVAY